MSIFHEPIQALRNCLHGCVANSNQHRIRLLIHSEWIFFGEPQLNAHGRDRIECHQTQAKGGSGSRRQLCYFAAFYSSTFQVTTAQPAAITALGFFVETASLLLLIAGAWIALVAAGSLGWFALSNKVSNCSLCKMALQMCRSVALVSAHTYSQS